MLYLADSALDSPVVAWSFWDGAGGPRRMAGDEDEPPYRSGLAALREFRMPRCACERSNDVALPPWHFSQPTLLRS